MKKKSVLFAILAVVLFAAGIGCYFLPWIYQVEKGQGGYNEGYKAALNFDGSGNNLLSFAGLVFLVLAFLVALVLMIIKLARIKKPDDPDKPLNVKKAVLVLVFASLFIFIPLIGAASLMECYGIAGDTYEMGGKIYGYFVGPGVPLSSICAVLGGVSFFYAYSGFIG